jgi:ribonuclease-3
METERKTNNVNNILGEEFEKKINPYNFNNKLITKLDIENLLHKYGIYQNINNLELYQRAFVHESYSWTYIKDTIRNDNIEIVEKPEGAIELKPESYEALEFLGDRIANAVVAHYLTLRYPNSNEGFLSDLNGKLISAKGYSKLARTLNLGQYILLSRHQDEKNNGREDDDILCDVFEAFICALYRDFSENQTAIGYLTCSEFGFGPGYLVAHKFIFNLLEDEGTDIDFVELIIKQTNYKSKVNTYFQKHLKLKVSYQLDYKDLTPSGTINFVSLRGSDGKIYGFSYGSNVKKIEQRCAKDALIRLNQIQPNDDDDDKQYLNEFDLEPYQEMIDNYFQRFQ